MEWISWSNGAYLLAILAGGYLTLASKKYRNLIKEVKEALEVYSVSMKDGKLSDVEKDKLLKEVLDILQAGIKLFWKF